MLVFYTSENHVLVLITLALNIQTACNGYLTGSVSHWLPIKTQTDDQTRHVSRNHFLNKNSIKCSNLISDA